MILKFGITYDLRNDYLEEGYSELDTAEFDRPDTIDSIEQAIRQSGHRTERIGHVRALTAKLSAGCRWDMVFNIAEGLYGFGREAQVPALLDAYRIPYVFSDPLVLSLTLHKGMTKHVIRDLGIPTPDFVVIEKEEEIKAINLPFPLFAKPVAEGTGKGIDGTSRIESPQALAAICKKLLETHGQPVIVETFLPGREFTVGIVGTGSDASSVGVAEIYLREQAEKDAYSYKNKEFCEELVEYRPVDSNTAGRAEEIALAAWRSLGCRDGGRVDVRADAGGTINFLEVNPLAGLHPEHSDLPIICNLYGISYQELIDRIIHSALQRFRN